MSTTDEFFTPDSGCYRQGGRGYRLLTINVALPQFAIHLEYRVPSLDSQVRGMSILSWGSHAGLVVPLASEAEDDG